MTTTELLNTLYCQQRKSIRFIAKELKMSEAKIEKMIDEQNLKNKLPCFNCGTFVKIKKTAKPRYCSYKCMHEHTKEHKNELTRIWKEKKARELGLNSYKEYQQILWKRFKDKNPEYSTYRFYKWRYNLTQEEFNNFKSKTNCEICGKITKLHLDHSHSTGRIRGGLCRPCNQSLGFIKEDINVLQNMIAYIKKYN